MAECGDLSPVSKITCIWYTCAFDARHLGNHGRRVLMTVLQTRYMFVWDDRGNWVLDCVVPY